MRFNSTTRPIPTGAMAASCTTRTGSADLTPMLDTIFLIILLLLATLMHSSIVRGFPVNCPAFAERTDVQKDSAALEVSVDKEGRVYIGKAQVALADMPPLLQEASLQMASEKVLVRGDDAAAYGRVAHVLARVSQALPHKQVILVTQAPTEDTGPTRKTDP